MQSIIPSSDSAKDSSKTETISNSTQSDRSQKTRLKSITPLLVGRSSAINRKITPSTAIHDLEVGIFALRSKITDEQLTAQLEQEEMYQEVAAEVAGFLAQMLALLGT
jgi:hypothetical protein